MEKNKKIPKTVEPEIGEWFKVKGIWLKDIEGRMGKGILDIKIRDEETDQEKIYKVQENWGLQKRKLSDFILDSLSQAGCKIPYKEVSIFKIQYLRDPEKVYYI